MTAGEFGRSVISRSPSRNPALASDSAAFSAMAKNSPLRIQEPFHQRDSRSGSPVASAATMSSSLPAISVSPPFPSPKAFEPLFSKRQPPENRIRAAPQLEIRRVQHRVARFPAGFSDLDILRRIPERPLRSADGPPRCDAKVFRQVPLRFRAALEEDSVPSRQDVDLDDAFIGRIQEASVRPRSQSGQRILSQHRDRLAEQGRRPPVDENGPSAPDHSVCAKGEPVRRQPHAAHD